MANPYQIEDGESMASVRSKLNQMGEAVDGSATKEYVDNNLKKTTHIFDMPSEGTNISEHLNVLNNGGTIAYKALDGKGNPQYYYIQDHFVSGNYIVIFRAESSGNDIGEYKSIFYNESGVCTHIDGHMKEGLPAWGTTGQVLTKTATGTGWEDPSGGNNTVYVTQEEYDALTPKENVDYVIYGDGTEDGYVTESMLETALSGKVSSSSVSVIVDAGSSLPTDPDPKTLYLITS